MIVSIIIPTYNSLSKLKQALESIELIDFPAESFEVVVVDDGSTDQTAEFLAEYAKSTKLMFLFFCQSNRGPAAARNVAIQNAKGDYLLSIDSDCLVDKNILNEYLKHFPCEGLAGIGGHTVPKDLNFMTSYLEFRGGWNHSVVKDTVVSLVTCNAFFCKKAVLDVGGFDEDFRSPGGEDDELSYRLRKNGFFLKLDKKAIVTHDHRTTLKGLVKTYRTYGNSLKILEKKCDGFGFSKTRLLKVLFGYSALFFAFRAIRYVNPIKAISYTVLEQIRLLSLAYGYYKN